MVDYLKTEIFRLFGRRVVVNQVESAEFFKHSTPKEMVFPRLPLVPIAILEREEEMELFIEKEGDGRYILFRGVAFGALYQLYEPLFARPVYSAGECATVDRFASLFNVWRSAVLDIYVTDRMDDSERRHYALHAANEARLVFWQHYTAKQQGLPVSDYSVAVYAMVAACARAACGISGEDAEMAKYWRFTELTFDAVEIVETLRHTKDPVKDAVDWFNQKTGRSSIAIGGDGALRFFYSRDNAKGREHEQHSSRVW